MHKVILICTLISIASAFALPLKKGERFREQIAGEYIVKTNGEKVNHRIKNIIGKDLFLIESRNSKSLKNYQAVYPNYRYFGEYKDVMPNTPNDVDFTKQFHHEMIQTTKAWAIATKGTAEIIVAVADNEFQINHRDLLNSWWKNENEIPDNKIDDDNNGYVDDVYGWDFINGDNNVDAKDETSHGTHISGIIAAEANNKLGGTGIAPRVKVMPLRWFDYDDPWTSAIIAETLHYAVDHGAKIISSSYNIDGFVDDEAYLAAIKYARDHDVLIFNSAGNTDTKNPPRQMIKDVILVCSVTSEEVKSMDKKSKFSNYGTGIDICAPGDPVYSTIQNLFGGEQNKYGPLRGTSMSTPVVAAVAALIWSAHPNLSDEEVREKLFSSALKIDGKNPKYINMLGAGRVDALESVK